MMNQNDIGIDLLLGVGPSPDVTPSAGDQQSPEGSRQLFGDVLSDLLSSLPGGSARPVIRGDRAAVENAAFTLASASDSQTTPLSMIPMTVGALVNAREGSEVIPGRLSQVTDELPSTAVEKNLVAFNKDILAELPERPLVMKISARPVVDGMAADLPSGRCEIIASKVSEGSLYLTLANPKEGAAPVELTIPTNLLSNSSKPQAALAPHTDRVDLGIAPKQIPDVDRLLARLNLKQLEVSNAGIERKNTNDPVRIILTGEDNGRKLALRGLLPRQQMNARTVNTEPTQTTTTVEPSDRIALGGRPGETELKQPIAEPVVDKRVTISRAATQPIMTDPTPVMKAKSEINRKSRNQTSSTRLGLQPVIDESAKSLHTFTRPLTGVGSAARDATSADLKMLSGFAKQPGFGAATFTLGDDTQSADPFAGLNTWEDAGRINGKEIPARTVRFSLPDNLQARLQPNGQSVSIRIEPEHLGPARLALTISHDKLRARLTVETIEVKALVERSLDRLTQQLTKAGIDIDKIEVALDGRQAGEELFDRHRQWRRPARPFDPDLDTPAELNQAGTIPIVPEANQTYVGAGGVNVLA